MAECTRVQLGGGDPLSEDELAETPGLTSRKEMLEVMRDARYKSDPAYRQIVHRAIEKTDPAILGLPSDVAEQQRTGGLDMIRGEAAAQHKEMIQRRFSNPQYRTSALFRSETARMIAEANPDTAGEGVNRVGLSLVNGEVKPGLTNHGVYRATIPTGEPTGPNRPEKPQP